MPDQPQLQILCCSRFKCTPSEYEDKAFNKCLYWHARLLAPFVRLLAPDFFAEDYKFIRYFGAATDFKDARIDALNFQEANRGNPGMWRTGFKIRVSGRKASRLARRLFPNQKKPTPKMNGGPLQRIKFVQPRQHKENPRFASL